MLKLFGSLNGSLFIKGYVCMFLFMCTSVDVCAYVYVCMYICICACICVCKYICGKFSQRFDGFKVF